MEELLKEIFESFSNIGVSDGDGVTRLGYEREEDEMHEVLKSLAEKYGFFVNSDSLGNTFVSNFSGDEEYFLTGSHLDSVVNGGKYDGVVGVVSGLATMIYFKKKNIDIPMKLVAIRCEESSNFKVATISSKILSGETAFEDLKERVSKSGKTLGEVFEEKNFKPYEYDFSKVKNFIEVHIEQGRVLESEKKDIGIVTDIAGNIRFHLALFGFSEHSGATPMYIRRDALCGMAEIILAIENAGREHDEKFQRATVGVIENAPNSMNVVPGRTEIDVDIRGINIEDMDVLHGEILEKIAEISKKRDLQFEISNKSVSKPVKLSEELIDELAKLSERDGVNYKIMPSGAGHDAMNFSLKVPTGMIFIPCKDGVSHNPNEEIKIGDVKNAVDLLTKYYGGKVC